MAKSPILCSLNSNHNPKQNKYFELGYNTMDKGAPLHHGDKITCPNLILINPEGLKVPYDKKCLNVLG